MVGTIYGAETYCVFYRIQLYEEEDDYPEYRLQEENLSLLVVSKMKIAIENNESLADFLQKLDDQEKYELNRLSRLYTDLQAKPVKKCGFFYAYNHCRELINIENDKAVLKSIQLCPLKVIIGPPRCTGVQCLNTKTQMLMS